MTDLTHAVNLPSWATICLSIVRCKIPPSTVDNLNPESIDGLTEDQHRFLIELRTMAETGDTPEIDKNVHPALYDFIRQNSLLRIGYLELPLTDLTRHLVSDGKTSTELSIGRADTNDIVPLDHRGEKVRTLSNYHCQVIINTLGRHPYVEVEDLGSTHGTHLRSSVLKGAIRESMAFTPDSYVSFAPCFHQGDPPTYHNLFRMRISYTEEGIKQGLPRPMNVE